MWNRLGKEGVAPWVAISIEVKDQTFSFTAGIYESRPTIGNLTYDFLAKNQVESSLAMQEQGVSLADAHSRAIFAVFGFLHLREIDYEHYISPGLLGRSFESEIERERVEMQRWLRSVGRAFSNNP